MAGRGLLTSSLDPRMAPLLLAMGEGKKAFDAMMSTLEGRVAECLAVVQRQEEEIATSTQQHSVELSTLRASHDTL